MKILHVCGREVLVDDEDYDKLVCLTWNITENGYVRHSDKFLLHHLLLPKVRGVVVDHIDRNKLNNQKDNLRYVDYSTNRINSSDSPRRDLPSCVYRNGNGYIAKKVRKKVIYYSPTYPTVAEAELWIKNFSTTYVVGLNNNNQ